jgi:tetratricopeptide (TPR) repeat protein
MIAGGSIGRYRIVRELGRGAWGVTYEAEPLEGGPRVALKEVSLSRLQDWKVVELFEREARVLSLLTHPAVPAYIDHFSIDQPEGPSFCLVQQLAPGRSLADLVAQGWRADEAEAKRIAAAILDILDYLHARLPPVFHRDIKPQNILREESGKVWLVDFGAVRDVYRTAAGGSTIAGTFGYMAPEQLRGVARPESDLHGLGATLLFTLSGQSPLDMPQRKLKIDFRSRVRVSPAFSAWVEKVLEPAPEDRYASAQKALVGLRDERNPASRIRPTTIALAAALGILSAGAGVFAFHEARLRHTKGFPGFTTATAAVANLPPRLPDWSSSLVTRLAAWQAHFNVAHDVAFTPDGGKLLTGGFDDAVRVWDARSGDPVCALAGHRNRVAGVRVTPDGRYAVTAADSALRLWSVRDCKLASTVVTGDRALFSLALSASGTMAAGDCCGHITLWSQEGKAMGAFTKGKGRVFALAFSPDGSRLASGGDDAAIDVWDVANQKLERSLAGHNLAVDALAIAPDGQTLASASDDHTVRLWHLDSGHPLATLEEHTDEAWSVDFSPDGGTLLSAGKDGLIAAYALPSTEVRQRLPLSKASISRVAFAPDGATFADAGTNGWVAIWRLPRRETKVVLPEVHLADPPPPPSGPPEARDYAIAMQLVDDYDGHDQLERARSLLESILASNPRSARALAGLGRVAFRRSHEEGDSYEPRGLATALEYAEKAIAIDPALPDGYAVKASAADANKQAADARGAAATAAKLAPTMLRVQLLVAQLATDDRDFQKAERTAREALSRPMDAGWASTFLLRLGKIYESQGDYAAADLAYRREIEVLPGSAWAKGDYAWFLVRKNDPDGAITMAKRALSQMRYGNAERTLATAYCLKGEALLWGKIPGKADEAMGIFKQAQGADPRYVRVAYDIGAFHQFQGVTRNDTGEIEEARRWYRKALQLEPGDEWSARALALLGQ